MGMWNDKLITINMPIPTRVAILLCLKNKSFAAAGIRTQVART